MKTGPIAFNVRDRGRQHGGAGRNFDTVALAAVVNSAEVQERVRKRDLWGYYGLWPRQVFGTNPGEGGLVVYGPMAGRTIPLEPALVTTALSADRDGTITHEAEFLDNPNGRLAFRAKCSDVGAFVPCILVHNRGGRSVPYAFGGFDYIAEPNAGPNRMHMLDGAGYVLDAVVQGQATMGAMDRAYGALQADYDRVAGAFTRSTAERAELVAMLATRSAAEQAAAKRRLARLDSTSFSLGRRVDRLDSAHLAKMAAEFKTLDLPAFEVPAGTVEENRVTRQLGTVIDTLVQRVRG